jgi:phosphatidate cytidylyltransferase
LANQKNPDLILSTVEEIISTIKIRDLNNLHSLLDDRDFINKALIITCLSMLLEVFGHVFISVSTSFGYLLYFLNSHFVLLSLYFAQWSDVAGLIFGSIFGKTPFARSISPTKTLEGLYGALCFPIVIGFIFYFIGLCSDGVYALKMPILDYTILAIVCGCLAVFGDLIESFLKRCSDIKDSGTVL